LNALKVARESMRRADVRLRSAFGYGWRGTERFARDELELAVERSQALPHHARQHLGIADDARVDEQLMPRGR
jgi:hypothetical protein